MKDAIGYLRVSSREQGRLTSREVVYEDLRI